MNWFYAQNGQQAGPVEDAELDRLVQSGAIKADTLVWHSGLPNWLPYTQARAGTAAPSPAAQAAPNYGGTSASGYSPTVTQAAPAYSPGQVACSECRQTYPADEVVQVEGLNVCSNCKPILLQKLREGVRPVGAGLNYAGFWVRFGAVFIDGILIQICSTVITLVAGTATNNSNASLSYTLLVQGFILLLAAGYEGFLIANYGATLGKMACGIQVVRPDGSRLSLGRAIGRHFAKYLSGIILGIGYIMAAFDAEKRALHDQICDSRVVVKNKGI